MDYQDVISIAAEREMIRFYLGVEVVIVEEYDDGWCKARWPDGRAFRHWRAQLKTEPWGTCA